MRSWSFILAVLFLLTVLVPHAVADPCDEGQSDCPGNSGETPPAEDDGNNATESRGETPGNGSPERPDKEDRRAARQENVEARKAAAYALWREANQQGRGQEVADERRAELIAALPVQVREQLGALQKEDGQVTGTYVSFAPDNQLGVLNQVDAAGTLLFTEVYAPLELGDSASVVTHGKSFHVSGDGWRFRLSDDPTVPMSFRTTTAEPFLLVLPASATVEAAPYGLLLTYPTATGTRLAGLHGDVAVDPLDPRGILVNGNANFHLSAERTLLPSVANKARPAIDQAISEGRFGAETTVLQAQEDVFQETVLYEDLILSLEETAVDDAARPLAGYTITVDSESHTGKTIAVTFETGLLDPENLVFRYFNVEGEVTTEAAIRQAASLADVLDPLDDGTVAEYWIVQDADGTQVLVSIPHFSVHQVQLMSLVDVVLERPSLVVGTIGAILLVGVATIGMFRRPEDDA